MKNNRLLLIEDDYDVAEMLLMYFNAHSFEVIHADNGRQGVEYARTRFPNLILLDLMLPDMDGYEVCTRIRQISFTRYIPIIFLTQRDERASRVKGLELGADDYITKPFDIDELRLRVQGSIQRATRESLHEPRTGLPTGALVEEEILRHHDMHIPFQQVIFTLEGFKPYSEVYGFMAADEVLGYAARAIAEVIGAQGTPDDFVGIIDDRFYLITHSPQADELVYTIQDRFSEGVKAFYSFADVERGGLLLNAGGVQELAPLMHLMSHAEA